MAAIIIIFLSNLPFALLDFNLEMHQSTNIVTAGVMLKLNESDRITAKRQCEHVQIFKLEKVNEPTVDVQGWTVHSSFIHQVPDGLELRHDLVLLLLGH